MLNYKVPTSVFSGTTELIKYLQFNIQAQNLFTIREETDKASLINITQPVVTIGVNATF